MNTGINPNWDNFAVVGELKSVVVKAVKNKEGQSLSLYTYRVVSKRVNKDNEEYFKERQFTSWVDLDPQMNINYVWFGYMKNEKHNNPKVGWIGSDKPFEYWRSKMCLTRIEIFPG